MSLNLPPYNIKICKSSRREPGLMVFNVRYGSGAPPKNNRGWIIAIDQDGKIVFSLTLDSPTQDIRHHPNGNLFFSQTGIGLITEIDQSGNKLRQWYVTGKWKKKETAYQFNPYRHSIHAPHTQRVS